MIKITMTLSIITTTVTITKTVTIPKLIILLKITTVTTQLWQDEGPAKIIPKEKTNAKKAYHYTAKALLKTTITREKQLKLILKQITQDLNLDARRLPYKHVRIYQNQLIQN